ncbi:MAG: tail fiber domain-containing protein [Candidatus Aenigmarchaeota archaeon]|nr:tail fiber domain-containing protein [Candidatus Aenigmarchaeota archaeon]
MRNEIKAIGFVFVVSLLMFSTVAFAQVRTFQDLINAGKKIGIFDFFFPFLMAFAVFYGLIVKSTIFGPSTDKGAKTIGLFIALAAAGFVVTYTPIGFSLAQFLTQFATNAFVAILATIVFLLFVTMFASASHGLFNTEIFKNMSIPLVIVILLISFGIYFQAGGSRIFPGLATIFNIPLETVVIVVGIVLFIVALILLIVTGGGTPAAPAPPVPSDARLKQDIMPLTNTLKKLKNIDGVYFRWNKNNRFNKSGKKEIGVIAQDVEKEFPELVSKGSDGYRMVDYSKLSAVLLQAVKDQQKQIENLKSKISKLESRLN